MKLRHSFMISLFDIKTIYEFFKEAFGFIQRKGIVAEWMEPDWFNLDVGSYSYFTPQNMKLWLQVYFRNTTTKPQIIQSARIEIINTDLTLWRVVSHAPQPKLGLEDVGYQVHFPRTMKGEDYLPVFFQLSLYINHQKTEQFIEELKKLPNTISLRIVYQTKEGSKTKEKILERELNLRDEYKKIYKQFLESELESQQRSFPSNPNLEQREILLNLKKWIKQL